MPRPEPRIVIYRYGKSNPGHPPSTYWSLSMEEAEEMLVKLTQALNDCRREQ